MKKNHYYTVSIDVMDLYKDRTDADANFVRYLVKELSDWRVLAQNQELYINRMNETLKESGLSYFEDFENGKSEIISLVELEDRREANR